MGLLILIEHPDRVPSLQLVGALFRGLGEPRVHLRGYGLRSVHEIDALITACRGASEIEISFEPTTLSADALEHLREIVETAAYVHLDSPPALLRVWRDSARVTTADQSERELPGAQAFARFCEGAGDLVRGRVLAPTAATLDPLAAFLRCANARVGAELELELAAACTLVESFERVLLSGIEGLEAEVPVEVGWPDGLISTHMVYPVSDEQLARWRDAVTAARSRG